MFRRLLLLISDKELRGKILFILAMLIAVRILAFIPIPYMGTKDITPLIDSDAVFSLLNTIAGGSFGRLSIVMLGIGPMVTASIVMQLLGVIVPKINYLQKDEGEAGRQQVNSWTRMLAVPLAALNAWGMLQYLANSSATTGTNMIELPIELSNPNVSQSFLPWSFVILSMVAGSLIVMWIGELITEQKMGNGTSLLVLAGIVARLPDQVAKFVQTVLPTFQDLFFRFTFEKATKIEVWKAFLWENPIWQPIRTTFMLVFTFVFMLILVIFITEAVRKLEIIYSRRGHSEGKSRTISSVKADLPIKVNIAGVLPIIFAVSVILFPVIVSRFFVTTNITEIKTVTTSIENYLGTEQNPAPAILGELPKTEFLGFYATTNRDRLNNIKALDLTKGQEIFGFTVSTMKNEKKEVKEGEQAPILVKNSFFEGTPLNFSFESGNLGFLPEFAIRWNGILAYTFFYFLMIIFFTYFYTSTIAFKTDEVAENLQKTGAYIPGYRPGVKTETYLSYVSNRLNVAGSLFLALIAIIPFVMGNSLSFGDNTLSSIVGGTTILILVSVSIETLKQMEAQAIAIDYDQFTQL